MLKSHKAETLVPRGVPVRTDPSTENPRTGIGIYSGPRVDVGQLSGGHCAGGAAWPVVGWSPARGRQDVAGGASETRSLRGAGGNDHLPGDSVSV